VYEDDRGLPVEIPEGFDRKPAGAAIGNDGTVACVTCGRRLPFAQADVVGQGYRCVRCSQHASVAALAGRSDVDAHLDSAQRTALHDSGVRFLIEGIGIIVLGIVILVLCATPSQALGVSAGGLAVASLGVTRIRASR
jgi:hypothetical protein